jgi:sulfoxide reductase heme-binding subunit YedZ
VTKWIKDNWQWALLNLAALAAAAHILSQAGNLGEYYADFEPMIESGKWAVRFLLLSLLMTPLNTLFGWRGAIKLRKPAGLWAFAFGMSHFGFYLIDMGADWLKYPIPDYIAGLGVVGLVILTLMAATSTRWAMKRMGKGWKRLHRMVYAAGVLALVHGLLEASGNKRAVTYDQYGADEVTLYLVALVILLAIRIPAVRASLASLRYRLRAARS